MVYFNKRYSLVTATTTTIDITIAEDITQDNTLELYVESALTNPATTSTNAFLIKTTYRNVIFD